MSPSTAAPEAQARRTALPPGPGRPRQPRGPVGSAALPRSGCYAAIPGGNSVDKGGAHVGDRGALDLHHVLGVLLAAVREVEAARVDVIVRDQDLRVHEVMHRAYAVGSGPLGPEPDGSHHGLEGLDLPRRAALC